MPKYMIIHHQDPQFVSHHINLACKVCAKEKGASWKRAYYNLKEGRIFCEWEAPDEDTLKKILAEKGFPHGEVVEVETLTPGECAWEIFGELED
jgi:hypothetical protein